MTAAAQQLGPNFRLDLCYSFEQLQTDKFEPKLQVGLQKFSVYINTVVQLLLR